MPSKAKHVRESQKQSAEAAAAKRLAELKEKGLDEKKIGKDAKLKHLKAKVRQLRKALSAISNIEKKNEELALRRKEKLEKKDEKKDKKKGKAKKEEAAAQGQKKGKKEKKKKQG